MAKKAVVERAISILFACKVFQISDTCYRYQPKWSAENVRIADWLIRLEFIQFGKPQQNAYIERYNRTVRHDWLTQYLFDSVEEVQEYATQWLWTYNHERPSMGLGGITTIQKTPTVA